MKLSKTQQDCFNHLTENNTYLIFVPYMGRFNPNAYYFAHKTMKSYRFDTVQCLIEKGYLTVKNTSNNDDNEHKVYLKHENPKS